MSEDNLDPRIVAWIYASCAKHFKTKLQTLLPDCHVHVEGDERATEDKAEWFEFRLDGPYVQHIVKEQRNYEIEVNIAICLVPSESDA